MPKVCTQKMFCIFCSRTSTNTHTHTKQRRRIKTNKIVEREFTPALVNRDTYRWFRRSTASAAPIAPCACMGICVCAVVLLQLFRCCFVLLVLSLLLRSLSAYLFLALWPFRSTLHILMVSRRVFVCGSLVVCVAVAFTYIDTKP